MLMIRLQRVGRKNDPSFRVVVVDSHAAAKTGNVIEVVGNYNSRQGKPSLKADRILDWLAKGAQVSDTLHNLLIKEGIVKGVKKNVASRKLGKKAQAAKEKNEAEKTQAAKMAKEEEEPKEEEKIEESTEESKEQKTEEIVSEEKTKNEVSSVEGSVEGSAETEEVETEKSESVSE